MNQLKSEIEAIYPSPQIELKDFLAAWTPLSIEKGEFLLKEGDVSQ